MRILAILSLALGGGIAQSLLDSRLGLSGSVAVSAGFKVFSSVSVGVGAAWLWQCAFGLTLSVLVIYDIPQILWLLPKGQPAKPALSPSSRA